MAEFSYGVLLQHKMHASDLYLRYYNREYQTELSCSLEKRVKLLISLELTSEI